MKNPEELIGKKVRGFRFENKEHIHFAKEMVKYIGKIGKITLYSEESETFVVDFGIDKTWAYPADQIESHLVEENEIPTFTKESEEYDLLKLIKFCLEFKNESEAIRLIEKYGFQKQNINNEEIPTLTDGVMMLVSDSKINWYDKDVKFIYNGRYYTFEEHNLTFVPWIHCKPIEPTKEEQLTAILGSSDKVAEIMELFKKE